MTRIILRFFDALSSCLALIVLAPLLLLLAILIKLDSPGPVFFRQTRVGKGRREFKIIKFRTMSVNADLKGIHVTSAGDNRVTAVGKILRRTKLDELPELWNVFTGDLSLVGPRPEVPRYVAHYRPEWESVFSVRPGITDLATLQFRDEESVLALAKNTESAYIDVIIPIKIKLAIEFVQNRSLYLYFKILILTVWSLTLGRFLARPEQKLAETAKTLLLTYDNKSENNIVHSA